MIYRRQSKKFRFEKDFSSKCALSINKIYQQVLSTMKILQTRPQVRSMNIKYYDLY